VLRLRARVGGPLLLTRPALPRRALAELVGTAFLVIVVVGSGIAAARLSPHDVGLQLLENAAATAGGLIALILAFGPVSGAHLNPAVSIADCIFGGLDRRELPVYVLAQVVGAIGGAVVANLMFDLDAVSWSEHHRSTGGLWLGEVVATIGLLVVVFGVVRSGRASAAPFAVGAYIGGAYFFTSSTSFANPAVTIGRAFSDTFAGIAPSSVAPFVAFQLVGTALAVLLIRTLYPDVASAAGDVVVPHGGSGTTSGTPDPGAPARREGPGPTRA
jgi:glycerol uptake facilitator-like aquaporin